MLALEIEILLLKPLSGSEKLRASSYEPRAKMAGVLFEKPESARGSKLVARSYLFRPQRVDRIVPSSFYRFKADGKPRDK